jgi:diadenosine tetraphosphatase ApaH/serine/threonine PP2A family protein phosphatase
MDRTIDDRIVTRPLPVHGPIDHRPTTLMSTGGVATHEQEDCSRKYGEKRRRRLHGHCKLLSVLPKGAVWPRLEVAWRLYPRLRVSAIGIPPRQRMGSLCLTAQPSVGRRVRQVQRASIDRDERHESRLPWQPGCRGPCLVGVMNRPLSHGRRESGCPPIPDMSLLCGEPPVRPAAPLTPISSAMARSARCCRRRRQTDLQIRSIFDGP